MAQTPAIALLEKNSIAHRVIEFSSAQHAGDYGRSAAAELGQSEQQVFKTLMVELDGKKLAVAMVPVADQLDLKAVAQAFAARKARMANPQDAQRATGYVVGGISPLGQKKRAPSVIDASALTFDEIFVSGGRRGLEIAIAPQALIDLLDTTIATIVAGSA